VNDDQPHLFGDLEVSSKGTVYASDGLGNIIYRLLPGKDSLEAFIKYDGFYNLQGLTLDPTGKWLFVADYILGVFRVDLDTKEVLALASPAGTSTKGIDGLCFYNNS
jgi:sugar lactone lactonase YvrE